MNINAEVSARRCTITSVDAGADVQQNIGDTITWTLDAEWDGLTVIAVVGFPRTRTYIELPIAGDVTQLPSLGADMITLGCYAGDGSTALRSSTSSRLALSRSVLSDRGAAVVINPTDLGDMDTVSAEDKLIVLRSSDGAVKRALVSALPSAVDSVNGQTGAVILDAEDVGADASGAADAVAAAADLALCRHDASLHAHSELLTGKQNNVLSTTVTIAVADWNGGTTATVYAEYVSASKIVIVDPSDANVECTAQGDEELTFSAPATPTEAVTVKVVVL